MFTGIIQHMGRVSKVSPVESGRRLTIDPLGWQHAPAEGDSIAINGCCLTLVGSSDDFGGASMNFDVVQQTLRLTTLGDLHVGDMVNLEHAATPTTMLGGHIVQGHVDGVAKVLAVNHPEGEWRVRIEPPPALMEYVVPQGSICVQGVSLTVADVGSTWFEVALIPTTLRLTNLADLKEGSRVNIEVDCIVKTVVTWLKRSRGLGRSVASG